MTITLIVLTIGLAVCNGLLYSSLRKYRTIGAALTTNAKSAEHFFQEYENLTGGQNAQFKNEHAMMCLGIAAHMGYDDAQARLAYYLDNLALQDGQYEPMQLDWRRKAAAQGKPEHQYTYASSIGFPIQPWEKHLTQEQRENRIVRLSEAFELYRKAAEQGYHEAQSKLAQYYLNGYGCRKDLAEALRWAQKAYDFEKQQGDTNHVSAMYIGRIYLEMGRPDLAVPYLEKGAIYGDPHATELWHKAHELQEQQKGEMTKDKSSTVA